MRAWPGEARRGHPGGPGDHRDHGGRGAQPRAFCCQRPSVQHILRGGPWGMHVFCALPLREIPDQTLLRQVACLAYATHSLRCASLTADPARAGHEQRHHGRAEPVPPPAHQHHRGLSTFCSLGARNAAFWREPHKQAASMQGPE